MQKSTFMYLRSPILFRSDEGQSRGILSCIASVSASKPFVGIAEPKLDVDVGGTVVQRPDRLGDHKACRTHSDERHGNGFAGEITLAFDDFFNDRVAPYAIDPMARIRQQISPAVILAQRFKRPV